MAQPPSSPKEKDVVASHRRSPGKRGGVHRGGALQAEVRGAAGGDVYAEGAAAPGGNGGGGVQPLHRLRVAEAEEEEGAQVRAHRPERLLRHRGDGLRGEAQDEEADGGEEQGAPHLDHHLRHLHRRPLLRQDLFLQFHHRDIQDVPGVGVRAGRDPQFYLNLNV